MKSVRVEIQVSLALAMLTAALGMGGLVVEDGEIQVTLFFFLFTLVVVEMAILASVLWPTLSDDHLRRSVSSSALERRRPPTPPML